MAEAVYVEIEVPAELGEFRLSEGVRQRLQELLDRQDRGEQLTPAERREAEGLVEMAEFLSLLRLRARRLAGVLDLVEECAAEAGSALFVEGNRFL